MSSKNPYRTQEYKDALRNFCSLNELQAERVEPCLLRVGIHPIKTMRFYTIMGRYPSPKEAQFLDIVGLPMMIFIYSQNIVIDAEEC